MGSWIVEFVFFRSGNNAPIRGGAICSSTGSTTTTTASTVSANDADLLSDEVGGYTMDNDAKAKTGSSKIVDWVTVELRSASNSTSIVASRSALLRADGDMVDMDGSSPVQFSGVNISSAYIAIRHRNYLGAMTASPVQF